MQTKIITLWQPYATLFAFGEKQYETRPKPTSHTKEKGSYLIHAAKKCDRDVKEVCGSEPFKSILAKLGYHSWKDLPYGAIIGAVDIKECRQVNINHLNGSNGCFNMLALASNQQEQAFGNYLNNRWIWIGENHRRLKEPIPYKSSQGYHLKYKGDASLFKFIKN